MEYLQIVAMVISTMIPQYEHCTVTELDYFEYEQSAYIVSCEANGRWIMKMISPDRKIRTREGRIA